jgi:filamentous hemagglutinin
VTRFAQKTVNFAKAASQRARGLVTALKARIGGFVNGATQRARDVANQARGLLGKVMGPFMGMETKAFNAVQSRVSQAVNMVKTAAQRGKDIALKVGRKVVDVTRKATTLLKEFTQSAIQKGREAVQKARKWSSQQIKRATELGRRLVAQARKRVADMVRKGVKLAKEKAVTWIKQKIGGIKQRVLGFLKDKWNRLKEKLGIKKPGEEGPKGGAKETPDPAAKKAAELPAAITQAKTITEANDAANTPVPALIGLLNASVKSQYSWIKRFEAHPKAVPGHYSIHMIASNHEIDPDYTTGGGGGQKETLLQELAENGVKHNADDIMQIARGPDGKIVFLEKGNSRAGLQHIIEAHADDFARRGVPQDQIPDLVMTAVTEGKIVGSQGKGRASGGGRAIYEVTYGGKKHYVAASVGNNGFIVGANPASPPSL